MADSYLCLTFDNQYIILFVFYVAFISEMLHIHAEFVPVDNLFDNI